ncbi:MAG: FtsX-like permease family protein, partial [Prolixibacteraceae bacterium]|nr:FtsX-like permease family protein [Prolixibacteraceae bacterium]
MNRFRVVLKSFLYYLRGNILIAVGIAISTAVLTGGLITGDSVSSSLTRIADLRLGNITHTIQAGDRFFRIELADELQNSHQIIAAPVLLSEAVAIADGGAQRANRVQVIAIDSSFSNFCNSDFYNGLQRNEIIISENLAARLQVSQGDYLLLRIKKESLVPLNAPFVSNTETSVSFRALIKEITTPENLGRFSLKNSQTAPSNVFMDINRLNELMEFNGKANTILIHSELGVNEINTILKNTWKPEDASLEFRNIKKSRENEIFTERVFLDFPVYDCFGTLNGSKDILTYFVNNIKKEGGSGERPATPYSFVSTLSENELSENETIINQWLADDLNAKKGDTLKMSYFVVGPLRKLAEQESEFVVKQIAGMNSVYADSTLMPFLPGMSDAGQCSEWEAGVPIDLDKIRDKDEIYWDRYKGTPKAFISINKAQEIWSNRFGNYTSIRFDENLFGFNDFTKGFQDALNPADLGFMVVPVKENGKFAAQNGVDFSGLFIGLSFFLLVAAILLSALLFLLNIESRMPQAGTMSTIGFKPTQIKSMFLFEGALISIVGSAFGLILAVVYTKLIFKALNTLWYDIVRTSALEISIKPLTLLTGFLISVLISLIVIYFSVHRKLKQQVADIQKKTVANEKKGIKTLKIIFASIFSLFSISLIIEQFLLNDKQNPTYFFISGGLLLVALLLFSEIILRAYQAGISKTLSFSKVSLKNITRNRSRSLSILILFSIGTFIVISTGSNRNDIISGANNEESGSGGFLFYAESTISVLTDLNDPAIRAVEGLSEDYRILQFRKIEGDDASCLNLNRIANPA